MVIFLSVQWLWGFVRVAIWGLASARTFHNICIKLKQRNIENLLHDKYPRTQIPHQENKHCFG